MPGHERFVRNMVAGATGIDIVILVVAADDGVMPQTREHLAILELVGARRGLVALTKVDAVDSEMAELAAEEVRETLAGTFLEGAPILFVSSVTGAGLDALREHLVRLADEVEPRSPAGVFRMPIQRVFSARGFGTILTGIPVSGSVRVGDVLEVLPSGQKGKVRGIQAYHERSDVARAGHSTALNLGDVDHQRVARGDVVAAPGYFRASSLVGAQFRALRSLGRPVTNRMQVRVHTGTADALGELVLLDKQELAPGEEGLVQFRMLEPLVCAPGDLFVARLATPVETLGGGVILEESRYRLKRFKTFVIDELERQARSLGSIDALLEAQLARHAARWATLEELSVGIKRSREDTRALIDGLVAAGRAVQPGAAERWIHPATLDLCLGEVRDALAAWFEAHPLRRKIDVREVRSATGFDAPLASALLEVLAERGELTLEPGGMVVPAEREVRLDEATDALRARVLAALGEARLQPPAQSELEQALEAPPAELQRVLDLLVDEGAVAHVGGDMFLSAAAYAEARAAVVENCQRHGHLEIPELRDRLATTRRFLIPLLEHFDGVGLTVRRGANRILKAR